MLAGRSELNEQVGLETNSDDQTEPVAMIEDASDIKTLPPRGRELTKRRKVG